MNAILILINADLCKNVSNFLHIQIFFINTFYARGLSDLLTNDRILI